MGDFSHVTFMLCLPRSRSAWMCEFLAPIADTYHDPLKRCGSIDDLKREITGDVGPVFIADTAAMFFTRQIIEQFPGARFLIVLRSKQDVIESLARSVGAFNLDAVHYANARLCQSVYLIGATVPERRCLIVPYEKINGRAISIWDFVSDQHSGALSPGHFDQMVDRNVQVPFAEQNRQTDYNKIQNLFASRD